MTQDQWVVLLLRVAIPAAAASLLGWVLVYGRLQPWWRDPIGVTLVVKSLIVVVQLTLLGLAVYLHLNRLDNRVIAWAYTLFTLAICPVMIWRTVVWVRASRPRGRHKEEGS